MNSVEIKAQIFDILMVQESLQSKIMQYEELKKQKLQELQSALTEEAKPKEVSNDAKVD